MILANFTAYGTYTTDSLYQWDKDQTLKIEGVSLNVSPEIHFTNAGMERAIVRQGKLFNGVITVKIPNSVLQSEWEIKAYVGYWSGSTFTTIEVIKIPIILRSRPEDYVLATEDEEYYSFNKIENMIVNMITVEEFNKSKKAIEAQIANIIAHNNDTEGNTELLDIRTGADGTVYESAGEAVRDQVSKISESGAVVVNVEYEDSDVKSYASTNSISGTNQHSVVISPNEIGAYFVKSATVYGVKGVTVNFSIFGISYFYNETDGRRKFTKIRDLASVVVNDDNIARIDFNIPLYVGSGEVLVATCATPSLSYGPYKDALYTIFNYNEDWDSFLIGQSSDRAWGTNTGNYSARFELEYILYDKATAEKVNTKAIVEQIFSGMYCDSEINEVSDKPVRNKVIYDELNIVETEIIEPDNRTWLNGNKNTVSGYIPTTISIVNDETEPYVVSNIDVRATTGVDVRFLLCTFRHFINDPNNVNYWRVYFTVERELGVVTSVDTHAVLNLDNLEVDPDTHVIIACTASKAIGYLSTDNGVKSIYYYGDSNMYGVAVGEECSNLFSFTTGNNYQGAYSMTYRAKNSKTLTKVTNVKNAVKELLKNNKDSSAGGWLSNKKIAFCGDSVTHGIDETLGDDGYYHTYPYYIAKRNGILGTDKLYWDGISGSTMGIATGKETIAFAKDRYKDVPLDSDYIVLWFGINDNTMIKMNAETLGDIDSTDPTTFYGAYNTVLTYFITNAPNAKIGLVVSHMAGSLKDAIRELALKYGLKVFDIEKDPTIPFWHPRESYNAGSVDPSIATLRTSNWWYESTNCVHPLPNGYEYISYPLENWLRSL